jgi:hypothetical protein
MRCGSMLENQALGVAQIAKDTGLTRQAVYRIKMIWWGPRLPCQRLGSQALPCQLS